MGVPTCPEYGTHRMKAQSMCHIKDKSGNTIYKNWVYYYCKCGDYFACEGNPHLGNKIGNYFSPDYLESGGNISGIAVFHVNPNNVQYTSKSTLEGYVFSQG